MARRAGILILRALVAGVVLFVVICAYHVISSPRTTNLGDPYTLEQKLGHPVPAVVLGMNSPAMLDRATLGAKLWKLGLVSYFIASGGKVHEETEPESTGLKRELISLGVPADRIVEESESRDTWQNLEFSKSLLEARHDFDSPVLILTHDYHGFRALEMARALGYQATAITVPGKLPGWSVGAAVYETFFYIVWRVAEIFHSPTAPASSRR